MSDEGLSSITVGAEGDTSREFGGVKGCVIARSPSSLMAQEKGCLFERQNAVEAGLLLPI